MISSGGKTTRGMRSIAPSLLSNIWTRFSSHKAWSFCASSSWGFLARIFARSSSAPEKSLSATSSRAPATQAESSSSSAGGTGIGSWWMVHAPPASASAPGGGVSCWMAIEGPSSHGLSGRGAFALVFFALESEGSDGIRADLRARSAGTCWRVAGGGSHGCAACCGAAGGAMCAWIRSSALRRNSRARKFDGSSVYASSQARTASSMRPFR